VTSSPTHAELGACWVRDFTLIRLDGVPQLVSRVEWRGPLNVVVVATDDRGRVTEARVPNYSARLEVIP
jgi:hypothetical protein